MGPPRRRLECSTVADGRFFLGPRWYLYLIVSDLNNLSSAHTGPIMYSVPRSLLFVGLGICFASLMEGADPVDAVTLFTSFEHEPPEAVRQAMEDELAAILSPIQAEVVWRSLEFSTGNDRQCRSKLAVIRFDGKSDASDLANYGDFRWTLGASHVTDGEVQPFCNVNADAIRAYVAENLRALNPGDRNLVFGRALARVLAHELYHIFSQSKRHSKSGLMRAQYSPEQLTGPALRFGPAENQKLRTALAMPPGSIKVRKPAPGMAVFLKSGCSGCHGSHLEGTPFGPPLRLTGKKLEPEALQARLSGGAGTMFQRAQKLKAVWPALDPRDITKLAAFLSGRTDPETPLLGLN